MAIGRCVQQTDVLCANEEEEEEEEERKGMTDKTVTNSLTQAGPTDRHRFKQNKQFDSQSLTLV